MRRGVAELHAASQHVGIVRFPNAEPGKVLAREDVPEQQLEPRVEGGEEALFPCRVDQEIVYEAGAGNVLHRSKVGRPSEFAA
jgi:hypothetical protein